jgi:hypothetical protein
MSTSSFDTTVRLMQALAAVAMIVVGAEWHVMQRGGTPAAVWAPRVLRGWWGWRAPFMGPSVTRTVPLVQVTLATTLLLAAMLDDRHDRMGALSAVGLGATIWHTAVRVRGTMNGGSDGMLFVLLLALAVATSPATHTAREGAVLFVAAQLLMSYLRAGLVKLREPGWRSGNALREFLAVPAYGVPAWLPRSPQLLQAVSVGVVVFELSAPLALVHPAGALMYTAVAWCFHLATAVVFGLNRFLLAWSAALPSLWYAAQRLQST